MVALALGSVAGLGAARVVNSHYSLMVRDTSQVFVAGPPVVARVEAAITKEELGGDHIHGRNGVVDDVVDSEDEAFERTRRFLSYLPSSVHEVATRTTPTDDPERADEWLLSAIPRSPRQVYKIRPIIESLVDAGTWLEIGAGWGRAAVCGLARLDGWPVALLSSDPYQAGGSWTADASDKVTRFVDLADTFHLPVVHLVDQPGFMVGVDGERAGTIRHGVRAVAAIHQAEVPWCSVLIRKVYGVGGAGHQSSSRGVVSLRLAIGLVGVAPGRGRCRGRLPGRARRARRRGGPGGAHRRDHRPHGRGPVARSAPPRPSWWRRSSTLAAPGRCCASSPTWPRPCANRDRPPGPTVPEGSTRTPGEHP